MRRALLDVNVLLALLDADHVDHGRAAAWLDEHVESGWASCAITENGFVRVVSQPRYPSPVPPAQAVGLLADAKAGGAHEFWACERPRAACPAHQRRGGQRSVGQMVPLSRDAVSRTTPIAQPSSTSSLQWIQVPEQADGGGREHGGLAGDLDAVYDGTRADLMTLA